MKKYTVVAVMENNQVIVAEKDIVEIKNAVDNGMDKYVIVNGSIDKAIFNDPLFNINEWYAKALKKEEIQ